MPCILWDALRKRQDKGRSQKATGQTGDESPLTHLFTHFLSLRPIHSFSLFLSLSLVHFLCLSLFLILSLLFVATGQNATNGAMWWPRSHHSNSYQFSTTNIFLQKWRPTPKRLLHVLQARQHAPKLSNLQVRFWAWCLRLPDAMLVWYPPSSVWSNSPSDRPVGYRSKRSEYIHSSGRSGKGSRSSVQNVWWNACVWGHFVSSKDLFPILEKVFLQTVSLHGEWPSTVNVCRPSQYPRQTHFCKCELLCVFPSPENLNAGEVNLAHHVFFRDWSHRTDIEVDIHDDRGT